MRTVSIVFAFAMITAAGVGASAGGSPAQDQIARAQTADRLAASGADLFAQNCAACHGATGGGDGPAAAGLNPKPRKLSDKATMEKISDDTIISTIKKGGAAMGKSPVMPAFTQLDDAQVKTLLAHIRTLCGCSFTK